MLPTILEMRKRWAQRHNEVYDVMMILRDVPRNTALCGQLLIGFVNCHRVKLLSLKLCNVSYVRRLLNVFDVFHNELSLNVGRVEAHEWGVSGSVGCWWRRVVGNASAGGWAPAGSRHAHGVLGNTPSMC